MPLQDAPSPWVIAHRRRAGPRRKRPALLIDGKLDRAARIFASVNPATGEVLGHAPDAGADDAEAAVAAARRAFDTDGWSTDVSFGSAALTSCTRR